MIAGFAADIAPRVERVRPIDDVMRGAAAVDPDIADLRARMQENRFSKLRAFIEWLAATGPLRDDINVDQATATVWTLTSPEVNRMLRDVRGWSAPEYEQWLAATLLRVLLP
jgi:K+-transporting ATPase c subunit